ncbi:MAG TPA: thioredoxin [Thermoanaerobaculia bacterium]|nr:thioredoxin [Thermoanaerobaculia bacterium]
MSAEVVRCPRCGQSNRVPSLSEGKKAVCGKCKGELGGAPVVLTDRSFPAAIASGDSVVDFWAAWCGPCRTIAPVIEELAAERTEVRFAKLNVDENPRTASKFGVQSIPLLIFFKDGVEKGRLAGAVPRNRIEAAIQQYLG